jgi:organic radical activating enzyme
MTIPISEVFHSFQGEGPRAGRLCTFIRTGGCNLACSWCDTPYTWDANRYDLKKEFTPMTAKEVAALIPKDTQDVVITGGEPLMHQGNRVWAELLEMLYRRRIHLAVETNGTILPNNATQFYVGHYSVSPKLDNAGEHKKGQNPAMAAWPVRVGYGKRAILKFVVEDAKDVARAVEYADKAGWPRDHVWVMPEGTDAAVLLARFPKIAEEAIAQRVNITQRLQILAFGDKRGT